MPEIVHPALQAEQAHLNSTLKIIAQEQKTADEDAVQAEKQLQEARRYDPDALSIREMLYARAAQTARSMRLAQKSPYFTRIDFTELGDSPKTYYIGKHGVLRSDTLEVEVVDWRAPVANLYYSGQIGPLKYASPDGEIEGDLTLKRQFGIEEGVLQAIFDADLVTQDAFLQDALSKMSGDRLSEIVTTIQAEQNYVIRYPLKQSLVVQGVAGSGKTTIALHRIAYLLYTYQDTLRPDQMMILAPNPLFLNYIRQVLPDLGVEDVRQTTFLRFLESWLGEGLVRISSEQRPIDSGAHLRCLGSMDVVRRLDQWLDDFEERFIPENGLSFGPVKLYEKEELRQFLLVDEKPFPLKRRMQELEKQVRHRVSWASKRLEDWFRRECERRREEIRQDPNPASRMARTEKLEKSLAARLKDVQQKARKYPREMYSQFEPLDVRSMCANFWSDQMDSLTDPAARRAAKEARERMASGEMLLLEDLAVVGLIAMRVEELKKQEIRHIVIDEAQDMQPAEMELLRRAFRTATFTVVGDLMQGIRASKGLSNWREISEGVFGGRCAVHELVTSYRNTVEIMSLALKAQANRPIPGLTPARPVLRHGKAPTLQSISSQEAWTRVIGEKILEYRSEGRQNIAVIARREEPLREIVDALRPQLGGKILDPEDETYAGGLVYAPAEAVKGLEFDAVLLADVSEEAFPAEDYSARLLYVCITRALHRLDALYLGKLSPLLN